MEDSLVYDPLTPAPETRLAARHAGAREVSAQRYGAGAHHSVATTLSHDNRGSPFAGKYIRLADLSALLRMITK